MADVFIGGYQGFTSLANPSASTRLRATGRIGLYEHAQGVESAEATGDWTSILSSFGQTGSGYAELPFVLNNPLSWFSTAYNLLYTAPGAAVSDAAGASRDACSSGAAR